MPNVTTGDDLRFPAKKLREYTVANVIPATRNRGAVIFVSNGFAGAPCLAFSDGTNWKQVNAPASNISAS